MPKSVNEKGLGWSRFRNNRIECEHIQKRLILHQGDSKWDSSFWLSDDEATRPHFRVKPASLRAPSCDKE